MLHKIIQYFLDNIVITLSVFLALIILSIFSIFTTSMDALPDLSENQVVVMTRWPGQTPTNIENQVSYPITVGMQGLA